MLGTFLDVEAGHGDCFVRVIGIVLSKWSVSEVQHG